MLAARPLSLSGVGGRLVRGVLLSDGGRQGQRVLPHVAEAKRGGGRRREEDGITYRRHPRQQTHLPASGSSACIVPWASVGGVSSAMPPKPTDDEVFDVYNSHVKHCSHCQGALRDEDAIHRTLYRGEDAIQGDEGRGRHTLRPLTGAGYIPIEGLRLVQRQ
eukprot:3265352-Pyramimonas_sp.AAC.1